MTVNLPADIEKRVNQELANGQYRDANEFVETALRLFLDRLEQSQQRLDALRRLGQAVDDAGLYEQVLPKQE